MGAMAFLEIRCQRFIDAVRAYGVVVSNSLAVEASHSQFVSIA
jgi:hypothetical protein